MALDSIRNKLKTASGGLAQASTEELAAQAGLPAQPITPAGVSSLGASPNQSKMAGSSAQKTSALRASIKGQNDLSTRLREEQARTSQTAGEKSEVEGAAQAQHLGDLQSRVQQLATDKLHAGLGAASTKINTKTLDTTQISDNETKLLVDTLKQNPSDQVTLGKLAQKLHPGQPVTQEDIDKLVGTTTNQAAGQQVAANTSTSIKAAELPTEIQSEIKKFIPGLDISNLSLEDIQREIQSEIDTEYNKTAHEEHKLSDPYVGAAERAEARKNLRDMGATGIAAAESSTDQLADKIANADTVKFNGQDVPVSQLLASDHVAGLVANYLADPDSGENKQLAKNEPELIKLVNDFKPLMEHAVAGLSSGVVDSAKLHQKNQNLASVELGNGASMKLSDEVMKAIDPSWGQVTGQASVASHSPILQWMNNPAIGVQDKQALNDILNKHPELTAELAKMNAADLTKLASGPGKATFQENVKEAELIDKLDSTAIYPDSVAQVFGLKNQDELQANLDKLSAQANMNQAGPQLLHDLLARGIKASLGPGGKLVVDWKATTDLLKNTKPGDLKSLITKSPATAGTAQILEEVKKIPPAVQIVASAAPDGKIDSAGEYKKLTAQLFPVLTSGKAPDFKKISDFMKTPAYVTLTPANKADIANQASNYAVKDEVNYLGKLFPNVKGAGLDQVLAGIKKLPPSQDTVDQLNKAIKTAEADRDNPSNKLVDKTYEHTIRQALVAAEKEVEAAVAKQKAAASKKVGVAAGILYDETPAQIAARKKAAKELVPTSSGLFDNIR